MYLILHHIFALVSLAHKDHRTNTASGIRNAHTDIFTPQNGDRPGSPNVALVITDGQSNEEAELVLSYHLALVIKTTLTIIS